MAVKPVDQDADGEPTSEHLVIFGLDAKGFDRGGGVMTTPHIGKWNSAVAKFTTSLTELDPGAALPAHSHNVEESVLVLGGEAEVVVAGQHSNLVTGEAIWVPSDTPHILSNRGSELLLVYSVFGGREVMRTSVETGLTVNHFPDSAVDIVDD